MEKKKKFEIKFLHFNRFFVVVVVVVIVVNVLCNLCGLASNLIRKKNVFFFHVIFDNKMWPTLMA